MEHYTVWIESSDRAVMPQVLLTAIKCHTE